ncbi:NADPH-dependent F420 reductase [Vitiosangium sp. GDMCC 1.1324]|uniref:NADPH-dependent F420 reductase n=1 Tax=Vitiosangium sp. (strain GDMCC 1.1324) TaxID=2138576 RepID=UPI000D3850A2|nr:NAD(P)-binding domain-containing protein [Vitiosangium sp. GDMCC 1.1324]PTL85770.1 NADP oxidoreductase [Vitiosangium sp. GDMCC 1.1324]
MKIAVLGTGMVGETIASKLVSLGHEVKMGSRSANNEKAAAWVKKAGPKASQGTFAEASSFGEILFNCTSGSGSIEALEAAGRQNLRGKILVDIANPLEFTKGMPPTLFVSNNDSLGERIQRAFPELKVVKTLNTINASVMVEPGRLPGAHAVFVSGNDVEAKGQVKQILEGWFGWKEIIDLGDITTSRGTESYLLLWLRLWGALGTPEFNIHIVKKG